MTFGGMHERLRLEYLQRARQQSAEIAPNTTSAINPAPEFLAVPDLGAGSPEQQAERVLRFLNAKKLLEASDPVFFHLLGQSTGGLVSRVLSHHPQLQAKVRSVMTIGSPHHGATAAEFALEFSQRHPILNVAFKSVGYDARKRAETYRYYTREALKEFNRRFQPGQCKHEISLLCQVNQRECALPLRFFYRKLHERLDRQPALSDGFVSIESQTFGRTVGPFKLDHFSELGIFLHSSKHVRAVMRTEFTKLVDEILQVIQLALTENPSPSQG